MLLTEIVLKAKKKIVGLFKKFWNEVIDFAQRAIRKVQEKIHRSVVGIQVYMKRRADGLIEKKQKNFIKNEMGQYEAVITREVVKEDKLPKQEWEHSPIEEEFEITNELENEIR